MFVFLQGFRATAIPMIAIPVSLVATFGMMAVFGFSINTLTLCGLVLAIGLVVDDAIIVVENIEKFLERGMQPLEATRAAMAEITAPIVTIGLVLGAVFVPVAFIPGLTGRLYNQFALTIVFSFLFSAFNSLTFTPAIARLLLKPKHGETKFPPFRWFNRGLKWVENSYDSFLDFGARYWWAIVLPSLGLLALTGWLIYERPKAFIPTEDQGYLIVVVQTPDGTTREPTSRAAQRAGQIAGELHGVRDVLILDGYNAINAINQTNTATAFVILEDWHHRTAPELRAAGLAADLQRRLSEQIVEARAAVLQPPPIQGLSSTGGFDFMIEDRESKGVEATAAVADQFLEAARKRPELAGVFTTFSAKVPQLRFDVDRIKARRLDVPVSDVFSVLQTNLGAYYVNDFNLYGKTWKVMVQAESRDRHRPEDVGRLYVLNRKGDRVPLSALGQVKYALGPIDVPHYNMYTSARITGQPAPGYSSGQAVAAMEQVAAEVLPEGFGYEWTGTTYQEQKTGNMATYIFAMSIIMRLPVHVGPVRELDPPAGHHPDGAAGDLRRDGRPLALRHAAGPLRPDRPGHADRPGDQERDPDRRVRRRADGEARDEHHRLGQGGVAAAAPADPDDFVRVRLRRPADGPGHRRRGLQPQLAGHRDRLRDRGQHGPRAVRHPDLLRPRRAVARPRDPPDSGRRRPRRPTGTGTPSPPSPTSLSPPRWGR